LSPEYIEATINKVKKALTGGKQFVDDNDYDNHYFIAVIREE